jgi:cytochrome c oxidase assembly protein subunit 15
MRTDIDRERPEWIRFVRFSQMLWILTLITMVLGPYVRAEDAGLACPDWPLCFGHVIPPYEYRVYLEFLHRVVAGFMGLVFLAWLFYLISVPTIRQTFFKPAVLALLLLVLQIFLGRATVTELLNPCIVKSHLLNAILYLAVILYIWKRGRAVIYGSANTMVLPPRWLQTTVLLAIFFQIFLGGRVSTNNAGEVCSEFPGCYVEHAELNGEVVAKTVYFPSMKDRAFEIHMSHRYMGYMLVILVGLLAWKSRGTILASRNGLLLALLSVQIFLGAFNVRWSLPVPVTVMHSFTAIVLFMVAWLNLLEFRYHEHESHT